MKQTVAILILCSLVAILIPFSASAVFSLVPCGRSDQQTPGNPHANCTLQHLIILIIRVINYLISMAGVVAIYFVVNAGFGLVLALGNAEKIETNKEAIQNAVVGLAIVFLAFVFVNLLVNGIFGTSSTGRKWWDPACLYDITNTAGGCPALKFGGLPAPVVTTPPGPAPTPSGDLAGLADAIRGFSNIILSTSADCGGNNHAQGVIDALSASQFPPVCSPSCPSAPCVAGGTSGTVSVNPNILAGLLSVASAEPAGFTITSLTTGRHSSGSAHYAGEAVDIVPTDTNRATWMRVRDSLDAVGGNAICENTSTRADVLNCNAAQVNHIHWALQNAVGGQCTGSTCSDSSVNICAPVMPADNCDLVAVNGWSAQVAAGAAASAQICSGPNPVNTVKMLKSIMANESDGGVRLVSFDNSSFGLFHMKPATANTAAYKTACGVTATVDRAWLLDTANAEKQACLAAEYLKTLVSSCGCDIKQIAAAYNGGSGACAASVNCGALGLGGACGMCPGQTRPTRRWECLWDDNSHTQCNAASSGGGYAQTRIYAPAVEACYGRF